MYVRNLSFSELGSVLLRGSTMLLNFTDGKLEGPNEESTLRQVFALGDKGLKRRLTAVMKRVIILGGF